MNNDITSVKSLMVDDLKLRKRNMTVKGKKAKLRKRLISAMEKDISCNLPNTNEEFISRVDFDIFTQDFIEFKKFELEAFLAKDKIQGLTHLREKIESKKLLWTSSMLYFI